MCFNIDAKNSCHCRTNSAIDTEVIPYVPAGSSAEYPVSCIAYCLLRPCTGVWWERHPAPDGCSSARKDGWSRRGRERSRRSSVPANAEELGETDWSVWATELVCISILERKRKESQVCSRNLFPLLLLQQDSSTETHYFLSTLDRPSRDQ